MLGLSVSWLRGSRDVSNTLRAHKTVRENHHTLVIRGAQFTDSGTYTVEVKNSNGTVRAYCSVMVNSYSVRPLDEHVYIHCAKILLLLLFYDYNYNALIDIGR